MGNDLTALRDLAAKWRAYADTLARGGHYRDCAKDLERWLDQAEAQLSVTTHSLSYGQFYCKVVELFGTKEETHAKRLSDAQAPRG